jgi:hypothetical protein
MHPLPTQSSAAHSRQDISAFVEAYTELLHAHEQAAALGQPLLTEVGLSYLRQQVLPLGSSQTPQSESGEAVRPSLTKGILPHWDAETRRLWLGGFLVKEFRQPAANQTRLLEVFEEQGWATGHIDDPLPRQPEETEEDAKRRLHETIKNLNRGLLPATIRFRGDGTGEGVRWEYDHRWVAKR